MYQKLVIYHRVKDIYSYMTNSSFLLIIFRFSSPKAIGASSSCIHSDKLNDNTANFIHCFSSCVIILLRKQVMLIDEKNHQGKNKCNRARRTLTLGHTTRVTFNSISVGRKLIARLQY